MAANRNALHLIERLPTVRGDLKPDVPMARYTWFKVGGAAEVLYRPADEADLCAFLSQLPTDIPVCIIGNASNLLIRDGGVPGVVIRLGRAFSDISINGGVLQVGAGAADLSVARKARDSAVGGLEFLSGIPGTIGGAVRMNGGAYGAEIKDICTHARAVDRAGNVHDLSAAELGFSYRHSTLDPDWIITAATLQGRPAPASEITQRMETIQSDREQSQPVRTLTGGSTFANPKGHKAWQLIDQAGCRGLRRGGASVSELHCNFMVNDGSATAADIEGLGEEVRRRVFETSKITLEWEIRHIGVPLSNDMKEIGQ